MFPLISELSASCQQIIDKVIRTMIRHIMVILVLAAATAVGTFAQTTQSITLEEAIMLARTNSVDAAVALNELRTAYLELPHLSRRPAARGQFQCHRTELPQELQHLPARRRLVFVCPQQLYADDRRTVNRPEHMAHRRQAVAQHVARLPQAARKSALQPLYVGADCPHAVAAHIRRQQHQVEPPHRARALCRGQGIVYQRQRGRGPQGNTILFQPPTGKRERGHRLAEPCQCPETLRGGQGQARDGTDKQERLCCSSSSTCSTRSQRPPTARATTARRCSSSGHSSTLARM